MEGKGAAAWMLLLLASLLLLALSPRPTDGFENDDHDEQPSELSSSDEQRRLDSTRLRRDVASGGVRLPMELQQLAEDEIRHEAQRARRKHKRRSQHNSPEEEEQRRRRLWEQQERRRVDEERRRAHEPPRPEEPPQPTTRRPTYEERLREWQRQKEEHDRLVREREKEYEALTVRPLGPPVSQSAPSNVQRAPPGPLTDDEEEENERKLQDYIERNTPINAPGRGQLMAHSRPPASRQPWGAGQHRDPYESREQQRGYPPAYSNYDNEPERGRHREGSSSGEQQQQQLTAEDERQIAEYHERLETQLAQLQGPARQEFERQAREREDEYRRRLQQDHQREKTGCNQTTSGSSGVKGQAQRRPPAPASSVKGGVDPCASGPYPPYGDARYANRGPDGRPCPPPPPAQSRGETKGPSNDRDPYEQYRRGQESRYRPEQSKGPQQADNRYEEQVRAAEARWRAEQNKGPVVDPYAELRRADEARYLAQRNKGPAAAAAPPYEESRRPGYRAEQSKGVVVTPPPAGRYDEQSEPDWRRYEEMRRAEDSTRIQPAASKGSSSGRPNDDRQETLQPEVWNRVYQASYHRVGGDPAESSSHYVRDSGREQREQTTRPQLSQSTGAPSSRYGSHPAARPNHSNDDDDDQAGSTSNVRYEEHRRNEAVAPGTNPVKHNANQTAAAAAAAAAHSTKSTRPPATTTASSSRNATSENHAPNALRRNDNAIDFMRGLRPDRSGPSASNFPAPPTPRPPPAAKSPSACVWAVVVCCRVQRDQEKLVRCFEAVNCPDGNWDEGRCAPPIVGAANHEVGQFYRGSAAARATATAQR
ncbi:hypothetical protein TKK_0018469 [Trichogramma kaykai]|uniref:Chitin-binding type-2 domain-containing protein n=1 Tax=Trichogramma kaykai TaxID=54128 RepID=A0ABD2VYM8_9HYME